MNEGQAASRPRLAFGVNHPNYHLLAAAAKLAVPAMDNPAAADNPADQQQVKVGGSSSDSSGGSNSSGSGGHDSASSSSAATALQGSPPPLQRKRIFEEKDRLFPRYSRWDLEDSRSTQKGRMAPLRKALKYDRLAEVQQQFFCEFLAKNVDERFDGMTRMLNRQAGRPPKYAAETVQQTWVYEEVALASEPLGFFVPIPEQYMEPHVSTEPAAAAQQVPPEAEAAAVEVPAEQHMEPHVSAEPSAAALAAEQPEVPPEAEAAAEVEVPAAPTALQLLKSNLQLQPDWQDLAAVVDGSASDTLDTHTALAALQCFAAQRARGAQGTAAIGSLLCPCLVDCMQGVDGAESVGELINLWPSASKLPAACDDPLSERTALLNAHVAAVQRCAPDAAPAPGTPEAAAFASCSLAGVTETWDAVFLHGRSTSKRQLQQLVTLVTANPAVSTAISVPALHKIFSGVLQQHKRSLPQGQSRRCYLFGGELQPLVEVFVSRVAQLGDTQPKAAHQAIVNAFATFEELQCHPVALVNYIETHPAALPMEALSIPQRQTLGRAFSRLGYGNHSAEVRGGAPNPTKAIAGLFDCWAGEYPVSGLFSSSCPTKQQSKQARSLSQVVAYLGHTTPQALEVLEGMLHVGSKNMPHSYVHEPTAADVSLNQMFCGQEFLKHFVQQGYPLPYDSMVQYRVNAARQRSLNSNRPSSFQQLTAATCEHLRMCGKLPGITFVSPTELNLRCINASALWSVDVLLHTSRGFLLALESEGDFHDVGPGHGYTGGTAFRNQQLLWQLGIHAVMLRASDWAGAPTLADQEELILSKIAPYL